MPDIAIFGYLDDFLIVSNNKRTALQHMANFQDLCSTLGVPLASDKTVGPATELTFLGIGINTLDRKLFLNKDKRIEVIEKIRRFLSKRSQPRIQWQSMVGTLSFLSQIVLPGRAFM